MALIVHITEALGAGVAHSISQLTRAQLTSGHDVILIYSRRFDTPSEARLKILYPVPIQLILVPMVTSVSPIKDFRAVFRLRSLFVELQPAVIHLHSSKAGVLGRVAAVFSRTKARIFYSPRGFAFLREDVSLVKRYFFLEFERIAARFPGILIACSETEAKLAREKIHHPHVVLIENSADLTLIKKAPGEIGSRLRIVTSGRLCYQKAPWRFRALAKNLSNYPVDFIWIGGGGDENQLTLEEGSAASLKKTGWIDRESVLDELARADIFVMTSLWEGMPLSLIEAQAAGLPAVVSDVVGCRDVVRHDETGYICTSDAKLMQRVRELITNPELRRKMGANARRMALLRFSIERMHAEMIKVYGLNK
jgi:glycosyltransferase involved in cell wall biosynthesis